MSEQKTKLESNYDTYKQKRMGLKQPKFMMNAERRFDEVIERQIRFEKEQKIKFDRLKQEQRERDVKLDRLMYEKEQEGALKEFIRVNTFWTNKYDKLEEKMMTKIKLIEELKKKCKKSIINSLPRKSKKTFKPTLHTIPNTKTRNSKASRYKL